MNYGVADVLAPSPLHSLVTTMTATINNIQAYASSRSAAQARPIIVLSFAALEAELMRMHNRDPFMRFVVIGIHAAQTFETRDELYAFHSFLCTCGRLSAQASMLPEYMNYMHESCIGVLRDAHKAQVSPSTWVYHRGWWDQACEVITCAGARALLGAGA